MKPVRLMKPHPAALLLPAMATDEFEALVENVRELGILQPVVVCEGQILDGRHRIEAADRLGIPDASIPTTTFTGSDPLAYVLSLNVHRRHLTAEGKRELIEKLLRDNPSRSDRAIARLAQVDHKTVSVVRADGEGRGEIPHVETRTDTAGRSQPAKKKVRNKGVRHDRVITETVNMMTGLASALRLLGPGGAECSAALDQELVADARESAAALNQMVVALEVMATADADDEARRDLAPRVRGTGDTEHVEPGPAARLAQRPALADVVDAGSTAPEAAGGAVDGDEVPRGSNPRPIAPRRPHP